MDKPGYIPIPRTGTKCRHCGLSRSGIYNLIRPTKANGYRAVVTSTVDRSPGKSRGRRLVCYDSLMKYLNARVVPVERLNLRKQWIELRAIRRRDGHKPLTAELPPPNPDDLPEDAVLLTPDSR